MQKRQLVAAALACCGLWTSPTLAQDAAANYPNKPIRIVVGFPPGGATDILARILSQHMLNSWGQPVVIENRGGAGGTVAADLVHKATPDGYTLMMVPSGPFTVSASVYENLPYDTASGFAAISLLAWVTNALVVGYNSPINSLPDLIRFAKEKPGQLSNASSGNGSLHHLAGEVFKRMTGTRIIHVRSKAAGRCWWHWRETK